MDKALKQEKLEKARIKRAELKEPRDWKEIGWAYVLHFIQGAVCGILAIAAYQQASLPLAVISFACVAQYIAYQGLSFARKYDTVGRDMADFSAGYAVGGLLWYLLF